jgi:hypothetical protein
MTAQGSSFLIGHGSADNLMARTASTFEYSISCIHRDQAPDEPEFVAFTVGWSYKRTKEIREDKLDQFQGMKGTGRWPSDGGEKESGKPDLLRGNYTKWRPLIYSHQNLGKLSCAYLLSAGCICLLPCFPMCDFSSSLPSFPLCSPRMVPCVKNPSRAGLCYPGRNAQPLLVAV